MQWIRTWRKTLESMEKPNKLYSHVMLSLGIEPENSEMRASALVSPLKPFSNPWDWGKLWVWSKNMKFPEVNGLQNRRFQSALRLVNILKQRNPIFKGTAHGLKWKESSIVISFFSPGFVCWDFPLCFKTFTKFSQRATTSSCFYLGKDLSSWQCKYSTSSF